MTSQTAASRAETHATRAVPVFHRVRAAGRSALRQSFMAVWIITPLLPAIGAAISWILGL